MKFPFTKQLDIADCGPACLKMVLDYYGEPISLQQARELCSVGKDGVSLLDLSEAAKSKGFEALSLQFNLESVINDLPLPSIFYWKNKHFVVVISAKHDKKGKLKKMTIADPQQGIVTLDVESFKKNWVNDLEKDMGFGVLIEPSVELSNNFQQQRRKSRKFFSTEVFSFISSYFKQFRRYYGQLIFGMAATSLISLSFPFLTQKIVDIGVADANLDFISTVLLFQFGFVVCSAMIDLVRRQLLLHISSRVNISITSDFLIKLMKLKIAFFDSKNTGDIMNRINDQKRIESFISGSILSTTFSLINFIILSSILCLYSVKVYLIFLAASICSFIWVYSFLDRKRSMDYLMFDTASTAQDSVFEIVHGMQEIKLNSFEEYKKQEWEKNHINLFRLSLKNLKIDQYQSIGTMFFNQLKNVVCTFLVAGAVIQGELTLGMMLGISMILGQLSSPIDELLSFIKSHQLAKISISRMNEVYAMPEENSVTPTNRGTELLETVNTEKGIRMAGLSFSYQAGKRAYILKNIDVMIPHGKVTAIVGASGGGKTTLLKILLKFYRPSKGRIYINGIDLEDLKADEWRDRCGAVMQEGYIFNETILRNIVCGKEEYDMEEVERAGRFACIDEFVKSLPQGYHTKIGRSGSGLSTGQKQRLLIARAIFRNPDYIFLDEATSSLDASNESDIVKNLEHFFIGKTVLIVAHRLSTVKNADQIIVLDNGQIAEVGDHYSLVGAKGIYYELVKNQLEVAV